MKVEQIMTREVKVCSEADTLNRAAELMWEFECGSIPVISADGDGRVVGIVTDRDVAMAAYTQGKQLWAIPVTTAMAHKVIACRPDDGISYAEALMRENRIRRLPVLDENEHLVGILSLDDIAREARRQAGAGRRVQVSAEGVSETLASVSERRTSREITKAS